MKNAVVPNRIDVDSFVKSLVRVLLSDDGMLQITLEASRIVNRSRWCFLNAAGGGLDAAGGV